MICNQYRITYKADFVAAPTTHWTFPTVTVKSFNTIQWSSPWVQLPDLPHPTDTFHSVRCLMIHIYFKYYGTLLWGWGCFASTSVWTISWYIVPWKHSHTSFGSDMGTVFYGHLCDVQGFWIQRNYLMVAPFFLVEWGRAENDEGDSNTKTLQSIPRQVKGNKKRL